VRKTLAFTTAVVAGFGAALVLALPVNAAGVFTSQIDTADPIHPGGPLAWSGQHDATGTLTWFAIADGGDPEGIDLSPDCAPTSGTDPVAYSCTLDPVALAPGGYTLVGQLTGPSSQRCCTSEAPGSRPAACRTSASTASSSPRMRATGRSGP
jgi:hypothetical protein